MHAEYSRAIYPAYFADHDFAALFRPPHEASAAGAAVAAIGRGATATTGAKAFARSRRARSLVHGAQDLLVPRLAEETAALIHPRASVRIIDRAGHNPFFEQTGGVLCHCARVSRRTGRGIMKRSDAVVFSALACMVLAVGGFVGVQIWRAPARVRAVTTAAADTAVAVPRRRRTISAVSNHLRFRRPGRAITRKSRVCSPKSKGTTYMDAILAERGGNVARWVERRGNPVTVWIQPTTTLRDFWPDFKDRARDAFYTWAAAGVPMRFLFVDDSSQAEVHVVWVDRFDDSAAGKTYWSRDKNWWIVGANIEIAPCTGLDGRGVRLADDSNDRATRGGGILSGSITVRTRTTLCRRRCT